MRRILFLTACTATLAGTARGQGTTFLGRPASAWTHELSDTKPDVRQNAAFALGRIGAGAPGATSELVKCLHDSDAGVRAKAAEAIGDIVLSLQGGGASAREAAEPTLTEALAEDTDSHVRAAAAYALGAFGEQTVAAALRKALRDPEPRVRRSATRALVRLGQSLVEAARDLSDLLKDPDALVRRDAAAALGSAGAPAARTAVRPLLALVKDERDGVVRRAALRSLVELVGPDDRSAASQLYPLLRIDDVESARSAALALAKMGGPDAAPAVPVLQQTLHEDDEQLQVLAAAALATVGPEAAPAVPDLARMLSKSRSTAARLNAAIALGKIGSKARDALPPLTRALAPTEVPQVRRLAAEAIMNIGSPANDAAVPDLLRVVESDLDPDVRAQCAWSVARRRDHESNGISKVFAKVIKETAPETALLRYEAAFHLAVHLRSDAPDRAVDVLFELFRERGLLTYKGTALKVSSSGGESDTGRTEMKAIRDGGQFVAQIQAARALGCIGRKAGRPEIVKAMREMLKEKDDELRDTLKGALTQIER